MHVVGHLREGLMGRLRVTAGDRRCPSGSMVPAVVGFLGMRQCVRKAIVRVSEDSSGCGPRSAGCATR